MVAGIEKPVVAGYMYVCVCVYAGAVNRAVTMPLLGPSCIRAEGWQERVRALPLPVQLPAGEYLEPVGRVWLGDHLGQNRFRKFLPSWSMTPVVPPGSDTVLSVYSLASTYFHPVSNTRNLFSKSLQPLSAGFVLCEYNKLLYWLWHQPLFLF